VYARKKEEGKKCEPTFKIREEPANDKGSLPPRWKDAVFLGRKGKETEDEFRETKRGKTTDQKQTCSRNKELREDPYLRYVQLCLGELLDGGGNLVVGKLERKSLLGTCSDTD